MGRRGGDPAKAGPIDGPFASAKLAPPPPGLGRLGEWYERWMRARKDPGSNPINTRRRNGRPSGVTRPGRSGGSRISIGALGDPPRHSTGPPLTSSPPPARPPRSNGEGLHLGGGVQRCRGHRRHVQMPARLPLQSVQRLLPRRLKRGGLDGGHDLAPALRALVHAVHAALAAHHVLARHEDQLPRGVQAHEALAGALVADSQHAHVGHADLSHDM
mmetsp:Transcript_97933/g.164991  ORF Transcript_97933/g.164991 Transcript_97933/m.164991 type:complete len:216 (-) Transcript_97933:1065-1712(-)